jgi:hypothetical protein
MLPRNDKYVLRRLRLDVHKGASLLVLIDSLCGDVSGENPAE